MRRRASWRRCAPWRTSANLSAFRTPVIPCVRYLRVSEVDLIHSLPPDVRQRDAHASFLLHPPDRVAPGAPVIADELLAPLDERRGIELESFLLEPAVVLQGHEVCDNVARLRIRQP